MTSRFIATYRLRADPASVKTRAAAIAVEQSVEMPLAAIEDPSIQTDIVGRVDNIVDSGDGVFEVRIALAAATIGADAAQLLNITFGNTSLHEDVALLDLELSPELAARFAGPRVGLAGLRARIGATERALTCSAIKPIGLSPAALAKLAERFALGGLDFIKDDHGMAEQLSAPFAARVSACAAAVRKAVAQTGHPTRYVPSLSGDFAHMRSQLAIARNEGLDTVLVSPMLAGFANVQTLAHEFPDVAIIAHPSMGGATRIAPALLIGCLFPLIGADAVVFPNHGGRFGYSAQTCRDLVTRLRAPAPGLRSALPVPAGGMTLERVPEMLDFYGPDVMLLIGGDLLMARENLTRAAAAFTRTVAAHSFA
jgi:ribulose-bisphosphate carboxylase large chain